MTSPAEMADLIDQLQSTKWFRHVDAEVWGDLAPQLERVRLPQGEVLFEQYEPGCAMYVVLDGRLEAFRGSSRGDRFRRHGR